MLQLIKATLHDPDRLNKYRRSVLECDLDDAALPDQVDAFDTADGADSGVVIDARPSQAKGVITPACKLRTN